jgi:hypothetical protein
LVVRQSAAHRMTWNQFDKSLRYNTVNDVDLPFYVHMLIHCIVPCVP